MFDLKPKKKSNEFFELFETSADYFYQGALLLDEVMMDHRKADIKVKEINDLEHQADKVNDTIIDKLESEGDHVFRGELAYLFENFKDPIELIKWKDLLEGLEDTLDHCEKMADLLKGVVMKYA